MCYFTMNSDKKAKILALFQRTTCIFFFFIYKLQKFVHADRGKFRNPTIEIQQNTSVTKIVNYLNIEVFTVSTPLQIDAHFISELREKNSLGRNKKHCVSHFNTFKNLFFICTSSFHVYSNHEIDG